MTLASCEDPTASTSTASSASPSVHASGPPAPVASASSEAPTTTAEPTPTPSVDAKNWRNHPAVVEIRSLCQAVDEGIAPQIVAKIGSRPQALTAEVEQMLQDRPRVSGSNVQPGLSRAAQDALNRALQRDERVSISLVPIGDGLFLARKR